jgi:ataxia telangiectasia mutated family protein
MVAERAILRLRHKLQGREQSLQLTVNGQVNLLIQEALDPRNLAKLFVGWQAYL